MRCCLLTFIWIASFAAGASPEQAVEAAHRELWSRFVDEHNLILDYVGLKGEIERPTPEDCRDIKPSTLSWGVPNEDGPMFNGLYLDAMCSRWLITKEDEVRGKARRLIDGLIKVSTIGKTPCFAAWVVTLCPDLEFVISNRPAIERVITHYDFSRVSLSQFFPGESAWWRMQRLMK